MKLEQNPKKSLHELDKKSGGREITGLNPKLENFSRLEIGTDIEIEKKNTEIVSSQNLDSQYMFVNPTNGEIERLVEAPHWRAITSNLIHSSWRDGDDNNHFYYTANIKGSGYLKNSLLNIKNKMLDDYEHWNRNDDEGLPDAFGLGCKQDFIPADGDIITKSKWLTSNGLRTELYSSYGKLKNIYFKGEKKSITEMRSENIIPNQKEFVPYIGMRLLKSNTRIAEVKEHEPNISRDLFKDAFNVYNQEIHDSNLSIPEIVFGDPESEIQFFNTFAERMGNNLAVLQNLGIIGWYMHSSNITLAAEIVDIGPYLNYAEMTPDHTLQLELINGIRRGIWKDFRDITYGLRYLVKAGQSCGMTVPDKHVFVNKVINGFHDMLDDSELVTMQLKRDDLERALFQVLNTHIIHKQRLEPLRETVSPLHWDLLDN